MSLLSLKIYLTDFENVKATQYMSDMYVYDICCDIREKYNYGDGGLDHGLLFKDMGIWLNPKKMLGHYDLKSNDILEFRKKHRILKVKTLDGSIKDESQSVVFIVNVVCERIGIFRVKLGLANPEEYSFKRNDDVVVDPKKKKKMVTDADGWLNPDSTFREQGLTEIDIVVLKKKFFYSDQNVDRNDPVQLVLMYNQSKEMILSGKHPTSLDEAAQFGAIQMQIEFGNHEPDKHRHGFIKLKDFVASEYHKHKELEKKIYAEHGKLQGTTDLNAKFRYVQLIRSMKTYGVSFFLVKEPPSKLNKKTQNILLGVTKSSVVRMDIVTKAFLTEWKLTQLRRWAATPKNFTLDFGDYAEKYYSVETIEGDQISRLISGYIDIIIKRRNQMSMAPDVQLEVQSVVEDYVKGDKVAAISILNSTATPSSAKQVGHAQKISNDSNRGIAIHNAMPIANNNGQMGVNLEDIENLDKLEQNIKNSLGIMSNCSRDLYTSTHLPPISNDLASRKWRLETGQVCSEAVSSHICAHLLATSALVKMYSDTNTKEFDYSGANAYIATTVSSISQLTQSLRMLSGLSQNEEEANDLLGVGKELVDATTNMLAMFENRNVDSKHFSKAAKLLGLSANQVLSMVDKVEISDEHQADLMNSARDLATSMAALLAKTNSIIPSIKDKEIAKSFDLAAQNANDSANLLVKYTTLLGSVMTNRMCNEQFMETAVSMREAINCLADTELGIMEGLEGELRDAIYETEDYLALLVEKARNMNDDTNYNVEANYAQVIGAATDLVVFINVPEKMIHFAKELTINTTRLVKILLPKVNMLVDDDNAYDGLEKDTTALSDSIVKMVACAKKAATKGSDKRDLLKCVEDLKLLAGHACEPFIKGNSTQKLVYAIKNTMTSAMHLIGSGKQAASSNRDQKSQLQLNRSGKQVTDYFPILIESLTMIKATSTDFVARHQLIKNCLEFFEPTVALISAAKTASSTTVDSASQLELLNAAQNLAEDFIHLKRLCGDLEKIMDKENISLPVQCIQADLTKLKHLSKPSTGDQLSMAQTDVSKQVKKLQESMKAMNNSETGYSKETQASFVVMIEEYKAITIPLGVIFGTSDENSAELLKNAISLGDAITVLIEANKKGNDLNQFIFEVDEAISGLMDLMPGSHLLAKAINAILKCSKEYPISPKSKLSEKILKDNILFTANNITRCAQTLNSAPSGSNISQEVEDLEFSFLQLVNYLDSLLSMTGDNSQAEYKPRILALADHTIEFLQHFKIISLESENQLSKEKLNSALKGMLGTTDTILKALSMSIPGQAEYNKAIEGLQMISEELSNDDSLDNITCFAENIEVAKKRIDYVVLQLSHLKKTLVDKAYDIQPKELAEDILKLIEQIKLVSRSGIENAKLITVADIKNSKTEWKPFNKAPFESSISRLIEEMKTIVLTGKTQNEIKVSIGIIAKEATGLCNLLKVMNSDLQNDNLKVVKDNLVKGISQYVECLKELAVNPSPETQKKCIMGSKPIELALNNIYSTLKSLSAPKLSQEAADRQKYIKDFTRSLIDASFSVINSGKLFSPNPKDATNKSMLLTDLAELETLNNLLPSLLRDSVPGHKVCSEVVAKLSAILKSFEQPPRHPDISKNDSNMKDTLNDQVLALARLSEMIMSASMGDLLTLLAGMEQLPISYENISNLSKTVYQDDDKSGDLMLSAIKYLGTCLISFAKSIDADQLHHKSESLSDLQGNYSLISKHIATVSKTLQDDTNPDLLVIMDASEKIQEAFITIQDKISYSKSDYSAISKVDKDGKRLITNFMNILSQDPNITPGEIATDFANIYESLVLNASAAANIFTEEELVKQLVEQVRELGGTTLKAVNILKKTNKGESKKFANEYLKEVTFKIVDLNKFLTANSVTIKTAEMVYNEIEEIGAELDTNLIFAEAGQLDDIGDTTTFGDQHAVILSAACILLDDGKKLVSERIRPQKETASIYENSLASLKTITTATVKATLCLTSSKNETQVKILTLVKNVSDATNALIQECQNCHGDKTQLRGPNGPLEKHFASVDALLKAFSDYNSSSEGDDTALKFILKDIDHSAELLQNSDAALGSALPAEVIAIARLLAGSAVSLISASSNKGSLQPILAKVASQIQDIARAGKAVLAGAPEAQRIETTDVLITLISSCRQLAVSSMDGESTADKKKIMNAAVKSVSKSVTEVVKVSSLLVPSGYVDPNDPNVIAERELLSAANAIEAAAKKLALLRPAERPREANEELDFGEQILEAAKAIASASSALVRSATGVQREIVSHGKMQKNDKLYFVDGTWSDGLVSAAKDVAQATGDLCEAANKASKDLLEIEFVIVSARNVSSATITLITAASVRGDVTSSSYSKLQNAGKAVTDATGQLVVAAESTRAAPATKFQVEFSKSGAKARAAEVDAQVNVLKMEKELERAREGLAGIRKAKYEAGTNPSSNVNFDSRKASSPHKVKMEDYNSDSNLLESNSNQTSIRSDLDSLTSKARSVKDIVGQHQDSSPVPPRKPPVFVPRGLGGKPGPKASDHKPEVPKKMMVKGTD